MPETDDNSLIVPVILSGGAGTRLWPLSRELYPKQFHKIADSDLTMIQRTIKRCEGLSGLQSPVIVCNHEHRFMVAEQLRLLGIDDAEILLEPVGRNTAPAIATAAYFAQKKYASFAQDIYLLVLSADHYIQDENLFRQAISEALVSAQSGNIAVFGVKPSTAHTGYGYIKAEGNIRNAAMPVEEFVEKPDEPTAAAYLKSGSYFWNCGIFLFPATPLLAALDKLAPEISLYAKRALENSIKDLSFIALEKGAFESCPNISIDYALLEKLPGHKNKTLPGIAMSVLKTTWSDIGSWDAIHDLAEKDENGNTCVGAVYCEESRGNYIRSEKLEGRVIATLGIENLIVVDTDDSLLIADKKYLQNIRKIVDKLKEAGRVEITKYKKTYRPWGTINQIEQDKNYAINRVMIHPGQKTTIQSHKNRSEHWFVLQGTAQIESDDSSILLHAGHSIEITAGTMHCLSNPSDNMPLEIIEIQCGAAIVAKDVPRYNEIAVEPDVKIG